MPLARKTSGARWIMRCLILAALPGAGTPVAAGEALRVMSFDAASAPAIGTPSKEQPGKPSWRTSFGSERETMQGPKGPVPGLEADIVLLQGVTNLKALQQTFPGRHWRLVVSRQMVLSDDLTDPRSFEAVSNDPATAIAVRYQAGLRVAGQEHFLTLPQRQAPETANPPEPSSASGAKMQRLVAGTAVRINIGGRFVWAASVQLSSACDASPKPCDQRESLDAWRQAKLASGEAVITGGLWQAPPPPTTGPAPDCTLQTITVSPVRKDAPSQMERAAHREGLGCAALAEAGGKP